MRESQPRGLVERCLPLLCASLLMAACAGAPSPEIRYYLLSPVAQAGVAAPFSPDPVVIGPLQLPGYLNRPQLMHRSSGGELVLREYHRWAEPLDDLFVRTLAENVSRISGSDQVLAFPAAPRVDVARRVTGRVLRFDTDEAGEAVLRVQWSLVGPQGQVQGRVRVSEYRAGAPGPGEAARVAALDATLADFARDLAAALAVQ